MVALSANKGFKMVSIDICAAFLQAKILDCDVFVVHLADIRKQGKVWKLLKPLYGLDDVSRKFWLKFKETLVALGLKVMLGDEAFYYMHENDQLKGLVLTHVDDLILAADEEFVENIRSGIAEVLMVSKLERDKFRFID